MKKITALLLCVLLAGTLFALFTFSGSASVDTHLLSAGDWIIGTLDGENGTLVESTSTAKKRICTPLYYKAAQTNISYTGGNGFNYLVMSYDKDFKWLGSLGWLTTSYTSKYPDAVYYRFAARFSNNAKINAENIDEITAALIISTLSLESLRDNCPRDNCP